VNSGWRRVANYASIWSDVSFIDLMAWPCAVGSEIARWGFYCSPFVAEQLNDRVMLRVEGV
jgi:hypothetical protein